SGCPPCRSVRACELCPRCSTPLRREASRLASARVRRLAVAAVLSLLATGLAACGGSAHRPSAAHAPVRLALDAPGDGTVVRGTNVEVRGTVRPRGASVDVAGHPAGVSARAFP